MWRLRAWLAQRFLDASIRLDPPPALDFDRLYAKIEAELDKERDAALGDSRESAAGHLRWLADMVERREVSGFHVSWLVPQHPIKIEVTHASRVGKA